MKESIPEDLNKKLPNWLIEHLTDYQRVDSIPQSFSDSTHHLWRLHKSTETHENHFLKVCSNTDSPFWQIMDDLFDFDLNTQIADFSDTYLFIDNACKLEIPKLIKAETLANKNAYILTSELNGSAIESGLNDKMVQQLADHLFDLHSTTTSMWGSLNRPRFNSSDWTNRLEATLLNSTQKWGGVYLDSDKHLKQALEACASIHSNSFVPMMPDLRWDQFLYNDNRITALVDLDAFVFAPRELDFVILEYIFSADQMKIFSEFYSRKLTIPDLKSIRPAYRLLLFYMKILGEKDLDTWMNKEVVF
jgi:hypothetical protein